MDGGDGGFRGGQRLEKCCIVVKQLLDGGGWELGFGGEPLLDECGIVVEQFINGGERELGVGRKPSEPGFELCHQRLALPPLHQQE